MSEFTPTLSHFRAVYGEMCADWCRDGSLAEFDRVIADVKADAWDEGLQAGWEECQNPDPFVNDWWDSKAPNPHRIEGEA